MLGYLLLRFPLTVSACIYEGIDDCGLMRIADSWPELQELKSSGTVGDLATTGSAKNKKLTEAGVIALSHGCYQLKMFSLQADLLSESLTDAALGSLMSNCPGLGQVLIGGDCHELTGENIHVPPGCCQSLYYLRISSSAYLTDVGVTRILASCPCLTTLSIPGCSRLTDVALAAIAKLCPGVHKLDLTGNQNITCAGITQLLTGCPDVSTLTLISCSISGEMVGFVAGSCPSMHTLNISWVSSLNNVKLANFASACPGLSCVSVAHCQSISDVGILALAVCCQALTSLDTWGCAISDVSLN